jgi:hypothetical protein
MSVNLTISKFNICDIVMSVDEVGRELGGTPSELATLLITSLLGQSQGLERSILKGLVDNPARCCGISKYLFMCIYMPISCSEVKERRLVHHRGVSLCGGTMSIGRRWKRTMAVGDALMAWCSGYGGAKMETRLSGGQCGQSWYDVFIAVEGRSRAVRGGWPAVVVRIQCFYFVSKGEATGRSIAGR